MILSPNQIRKLKIQISKDDAKRAISNIFEILDSIGEEQKLNQSIKRIYNDLVIISGNQNNLQNNSRAGLINRDQFIIENNKLNNAILGIVDSLENYKLYEKVKINLGKKDLDLTFEFDVFLCFSSKDINESRDIWEQLTKAGLNVFMSEEALKFEAGGHLWRELNLH